LHLQGLQGYLAHYLSARADLAAWKARRAVVQALAACVAAIAVATFAVVAVVLLLRGVSEVLAQLTGGRPWLGDLLTGILALAFLAGGFFVAVSGWLRVGSQRTQEKYARRRERQRALFGRDVSQRLP